MPDNFKEKVRKNIITQRLINSGDTVIVGVSGGADSLALLQVLYELTENFEFSLIAVHVNHRLRGSDSDEDAQYVVQACEKQGIRVISKSVDVKSYAKEQGISIEDAARKLRYGVFEEIAEQSHGSKIAVGHHLHDQAETVMLHLIRGSGLEGILGMKFARGKIIRPLLNLSRDEILAYCERENILYRTDTSNFEPTFTRNKIRLLLFPYLSELFGKDITPQLAKLSNILNTENDFIEIQTKSAFEELILVEPQNPGKCNHAEIVYFEREQFLTRHPAIQRRLIRQIITKIKGNLTDVENINIENAIGIIDSGKTGKIFRLPGNILMTIAYGKIKFKRIEILNCMRFTNPDLMQDLNVASKELSILGEPIEFCTYTIVASIQSYSSQVTTPNIVCFDEMGTQVRQKSSMHQIFDFDKLQGHLQIRMRQEGDVFKPYHGNGSKKLKKYFIDCKIEREQRGCMPLLAVENEILWIIGLDVTDKFKVTDTTNEILLVEAKM